MVFRSIVFNDIVFNLSCAIFDEKKNYQIESVTLYIRLGELLVIYNNMENKEDSKNEGLEIKGLDDDDDDDSIFHLKCSDGKSVDLPRKAAKSSDLLQSVLEDKSAHEGP